MSYQQASLQKYDRHCHELPNGYGPLVGMALKVREGRLEGSSVWVSCACFLINLLFLNVFRHAIHQIKAVYLSYLMVYIKVCFA